MNVANRGDTKPDTYVIDDELRIDVGVVNIKNIEEHR